MTQPTLKEQIAEVGREIGLSKNDSRVIEAVARALTIGAGEAMREDEIKAGHKVIVPGDVLWLPTTDWSSDVVVSQAKLMPVIRIIAIKALSPGNGAFSRMITGICEAHLTPCVIEPMFSMPVILTKWGWIREQYETGWEHEEQWWPPRGWGDRRRRISA